MQEWRHMHVRQLYGCGLTPRFVSTLVVHDVHERLIVLERAALQLDVLANEVVVQRFTRPWKRD